MAVGFDTVNRLPDGEAGIRIPDGSVPKRFIHVWAHPGPMQRSSGVNWPDHEANNSSPCNNEVKNERSSTYTVSSRVQGNISLTIRGKSKGKSVPLQASRGPEGSRKLRFPDFMTTTQDGCKVVSLMHRPPLPPGNAPGTHFC